MRIREVGTMTEWNDVEAFGGKFRSRAMAEVQHRALLLLALAVLLFWGAHETHQKALTADPGLSSPAGRGAGERGAAPAGGGQIPVGALLSLTGEWRPLGIASLAALSIGRDEIHAALERQKSNVRVEVLARDTRLEPALALQELKALAERGVRVVIGPQSSAEVQALKAYADANGIVLISQGSTASSLSIPGDNIFRLAPDDTREVEALVTLMQDDGVRAVVPLWRNDAGNQGLRDALEPALQARGGSLTEGVRYPAGTQEFTAELLAVRAQVSRAIAAHGAAASAIYLAGFEEVATILGQAQNDPVLGSVRWYGSDGVALSPALTAHPLAAGFAVKVGYPCPLFGLDDAAAPRWQPVADRIRAQIGFAPDVLALSVYDALWLVAMAAIEAGGTEDISAFKQAFVTAAGRHTGITGDLSLNDAGDRKSGNFDFWAICGTQDARHAWKRVAFTRAAPDGGVTLSRLSGCSP